MSMNFSKYLIWLFNEYRYKCAIKTLPPCFEKDGYYEPFTYYSDFDDKFGYGYNEEVLKKALKK